MYLHNGIDTVLLHTILCAFPGIFSFHKKIITGSNEVVAKVIFLHLSVILFTGGVCLSACWDTPRSRYPPEQTPPQEQRPPRADTPHPPGVDTPQEQTTREQTPTTREQIPPRADPPGSRHPPWKQTPPPGSRLQHTVYERPVRILLECILV